MATPTPSSLGGNPNLTIIIGTIIIGTIIIGTIIIVVIIVIIGSLARWILGTS